MEKRNETPGSGWPPVGGLGSYEPLIRLEAFQEGGGVKIGAIHKLHCSLREWGDLKRCHKMTQGAIQKMTDTASVI